MQATVLPLIFCIQKEKPFTGRGVAAGTSLAATVAALSRSERPSATLALLVAGDRRESVKKAAPQGVGGCGTGTTREGCICSHTFAQEK